MRKLCHEYLDLRSTGMTAAIRPLSSVSAREAEKALRFESDTNSGVVFLAAAVTWTFNSSFASHAKKKNVNPSHRARESCG